MDENTLDPDGQIEHDAAALARDLIAAKIRKETEFANFIMAEVIRRGPTKAYGLDGETEEAVANRIRFDQSFTRALVTLAAFALLAGTKGGDPYAPPDVDVALDFLNQLTEKEITF